MDYRSRTPLSFETDGFQQQQQQQQMLDYNLEQNNVHILKCFAVCGCSMYLVPLPLCSNVKQGPQCLSSNMHFQTVMLFPHHCLKRGHAERGHCTSS